MSWLVASVGSGLMPSDRAKTLAEPPGTTATAGASARGSRPHSPEQPVDHLVHRAVAAVHDHHVDAVAGGLAGDLDGVAAVVGVRDGQLDPALQRVREQVAAGGGGRRRVGVDDQHGAHGPRAYRPR